VALRFLNKLIVVLATGLQYYFSTVSRLPVQQLLLQKKHYYRKSLYMRTSFIPGLGTMYLLHPLS